MIFTNSSVNTVQVTNLDKIVQVTTRMIFVQVLKSLKIRLVVTHRAYIYRVLVYAFLRRKFVWHLYIIFKI
jgi:hypothetical protein